MVHETILSSSDLYLVLYIQTALYYRGATNSFSHSCKNLGKVQKVTVGAYEREDKPLQDLEGKDAMWYCYQVSVTDTSTGDKYLFPCKDWIQIGASPFKRSMGKELELKDVEQSQISVVRSEWTDCVLYSMGGIASFNAEFRESW